MINTDDIEILLKFATLGVQDYGTAEAKMRVSNLAAQADQFKEAVSETFGCEEREVGAHGDCDGAVSAYLASGYLNGHIPGESVRLCTSHAKTRTFRGEVNGPRPPATRSTSFIGQVSNPPAARPEDLTKLSTPEIGRRIEQIYAEFNRLRAEFEAR